MPPLQTQQAASKPDKMKMVEQIAAEFHKGHTYTLEGEFGMSFSEKRPVSEVVVERIWPTVLLVGVGTIFATVIGMISGVFAGWRRNGTFDVVTTNLGMVFYSMPTFWFGLLMIMLFSTQLRWFPTGRMEEPGADLQGWAQLVSLAKHLFLPAFTFAITYVGEYHLIMRSSITGVMNEDFTLTRGLRVSLIPRCFGNTWCRTRCCRR